MPKVIWAKSAHRGKPTKYYHYDTYSTRKEALRVATHYKKKNKKTRYFLLDKERGYPVPYKVTELYFNNIIQIR